ncbi:acireductone synthase [Spirulina major]|uniref:acireductone synthase n=1 Tax=Spirulina major TaxID=270636 RepID=UPI000934BD07|nr:acireductone synthase [Spirulina major]
MIRCIITDIEGTTTSISFVFDVLFPYFRSHLPTLVNRTQEPEIAAVLAEVKAIVKTEEGREIDDRAALEQLDGWAKCDRKIAPLKTLQGILWAEGFHSGAFQGHIYDDVPANLKEWHSQDIQLGIYSSGSVGAQKLLFGYSQWGDLTPYFSHYFDLAVGGKRETGSYQAIAAAVQCLPDAILFLSDVEAELDAAAAAGLHTLQLVRPGTAASSRHATVNNFDEITAQLPTLGLEQGA